MNFRKNSWPYKVAYGADEDKPDQGDLCRYFWNFVFMLLLGWPFIGVMLGVAQISSFFLGYRLNTKEDERNGSSPRKMFVLYQKWPNIKGFRILPIHAVLLGGSLYLTTGMWIGIGVVATIFGLVAGGLSFFDSETGRVFSEYMAAKKAKVCPLVNFTDDEQTPIQKPN